jgi:hypothetical protein
VQMEGEEADGEGPEDKGRRLLNAEEEGSAGGRLQGW